MKPEDINKDRIFLKDTLRLNKIKNAMLKSARQNDNAITFKQLNEILPDDFDSPIAIENLFDFLAINNIEIVTQDKTGRLKKLSGEPLYENNDWENKPDRSRIFVCNVEQKLLEYFAKHPNQMYKMEPRKFEELIASIFQNQGFDTKLTPETRDGGFDIIAVQNDFYTGRSTYLIECKRYAPHRKVNVGIVRELHGVVDDNRATKGIVATTSFFTKDAVEFSKRNEGSLSLKDYNKIVYWLKNLD